MRRNLIQAAERREPEPHDTQAQLGDAVPGLSGHAGSTKNNRIELANRHRSFVEQEVWSWAISPETDHQPQPH